MNTAIQAEHDTRAGARRENFQSRLGALQGVGQSQRADAQIGQQYGAQGADIIGREGVESTGFLTTMHSNNNPVNVNLPSTHGYPTVSQQNTTTQENPYG
jgi:hypothetical protein